MLSQRKPILHEHKVRLLLNLFVRQLGPFDPGKTVAASNMLTTAAQINSGTTESPNFGNLGNKHDSGGRRSLALNRAGP